MQEYGWILIAIAVLLWMIYAVLKDCLQELKKLRDQVYTTQGQYREQLEWLRSDLGDIDKKLFTIEETAEAYYKENIKARRGY